MKGGRDIARVEQEKFRWKKDSPRKILEDKNRRILKLTAFTPTLLTSSGTLGKCEGEVEEQKNWCV